MSTTTHPESAPSAGAEDRDLLAQQAQSGTPGGAERKPLHGAKEPHERDESPGSQPTGTSATDPKRADIGQASEDIERGLVDTDRRGTPDDIPHQEHTHASRSASRRP